MVQLNFKNIQEELEKNFPPDEYSPSLALKSYLDQKGIVSGMKESTDAQSLMIAFTLFRPELDLGTSVGYIKEIMVCEMSGNNNRGWALIRENLVRPPEEIEDEETFEGMLGL